MLKDIRSFKVGSICTNSNNRIVILSRDNKSLTVYSEIENLRMIINTKKLHVQLIYEPSFDIDRITSTDINAYPKEFIDLMKKSILGQGLSERKASLVNSISEITDNIEHLYSLLISENEIENEFARNLIHKGICFVKYFVNNELVFAPSRFIGYKNNSIQQHLSNASKDGSITNRKIRDLINGNEAIENNKLNNEFWKFCEKFGIKFSKKAPFNEERKFWDLSEFTINVYGQLEFPEGKKIMITHVSRERNKSLKQNVINAFLKKNKSLFCEVCAFDFEKTYGSHGSGFIECHHKIPVKDMDQGHKTKIEDIALLCSNCHRMIHKSYPSLSIEALRNLIQK